MPALRLILVVGLQKSGTSLLKRLLLLDPRIESPMPGEGHAFWGNEPPFAPSGEPVGRLYQAAEGERGHELEATDLDPEMVATLRSRAEALQAAERWHLNKNPYNSVRLPYVRGAFPEATIVGMVRDPLANVHSLLKKHVDHPGRGLAPEEGWWGVRPTGWKALRDADLTLQCARQWRTVNARILRDADCLDALLRYDSLCDAPARALEPVVRQAGLERMEAELPTLECRDHEQQEGGRLLSRNRDFVARGDLGMMPDDPVPGLAGLTVAQREVVEQECGELWQRLSARAT